jgi:hypothetical protein
MQAIWTWITANWGIVAIVVYELWSLIPQTVVQSSSILTLIGSFIKKPASLP